MVDKKQIKAKPMISIVVPSYNDEEIIRPFFSAIIKVLESQSDYYFELIYVDDGSKDGSQETLKEIAGKDERVTYIEFFRNFGQQRALFAGLKLSRGDFVVTIDGDYQYDPEVILQLVQKLESSGRDLASGVRTDRKDNFFSMLASRLGNGMFKRIFGIQIHDFGSVKAFSRHLVNEIICKEHCFSDVYPSAFSLHPSVVEVDVNHKLRPSGRSHWNIWMRIKVYLDLYIMYGDAHFDLIFRLGVLTTAGGGLLCLSAFVYKFFLGHQITYLQIILLTFIMCVLGINLIGWSLLISFMLRVYKQNIFNSPYRIRRIVRKDQSSNS